MTALATGKTMFVFFTMAFYFRCNHLLKYSQKGRFLKIVEIVRILNDFINLRHFQRFFDFFIFLRVFPLKISFIKERLKVLTALGSSIGTSFSRNIFPFLFLI